MAIVPAVTQICLIGDDDELAEMLEAPLVKAIILMLTAEDLAQVRLPAPDGAGLARRSWTSIPVKLSREKIIEFCDEVDTQAIRDIFPCGTPQQVARKVKGFCDAGMRVFKLMDYGGMGGLEVRRRAPPPRCARPRTNCSSWSEADDVATTDELDAAAMLARAQARDRTLRLGRRHAARALRPRGRSDQRRRHGRGRPAQAAADVCHWLLTVAPRVLRGSQPLSRSPTR